MPRSRMPTTTAQFNSEYGIPETLHPEFPGLEDTIVDFPEGKVGVYTKFFEFANFHIPISQFLFDILGHYQIHLSQLSVIGAAKDSCRLANSQGGTPHNMDLFNLISTLNPSKVRTGTRPHAAQEVPLLTATANCVIEMEDTVVAGDIATAKVIPEASLEKEVTAMEPVVNKRHRKRENEGTEANAPPKVLRKDHVASRPSQSTLGGNSLAAIEIEAGSAIPAPATQETPVSDPDLLSYAEPRPTPKQDIAQSSKKVPIAEDPDSEKSTLFTSMDLVDHIVSPGYFLELRHLPQDNFLSRYNINLAQQVAMGSQLRLRYEQEAKLLKKAISQVARRDQRIEAREKHIKNLEALLEAEADMKKVQVSSLQAQVIGEERIKAAFKEFKKYKDDKLEKRCAEMDARLDALSIDVDEVLYPHMLTAIAGRRWVIGHGLRLTVMKCIESLELRHAFVMFRYLAAIEAYDPNADDKYVAALHALKDLKYPLVDQLEKLKDAPLDLIMASLYLESDTSEDAPQWIRELRPSSSQLTIPVYPEVRDPKDPWTRKEEILLGDAIAANISRAEKKKKCRVVCRTHGVGSAHHARSDGVPVSAPTVAPQGLAILLADTATQTEDEASPRLIRSKSLPPMYHLDWP
ncbi:hypothetical protein Tco_0272354 [Tanacetum coccineum]